MLGRAARGHCYVASPPYYGRSDVVGSATTYLGFAAPLTAPAKSANAFNGS